MKPSSRLILFESYSLFQILCLIGPIRRADYIYFCDPEFTVEHVVDGGYRVDRVFRLVKWLAFLDPPTFIPRLVKWLNPRAEVRQIPVERILPYLYHWNSETLTLIDSLEQDLQKNRICWTFFQIVHDDAVLRYFKAYLSVALPRRRVFHSIFRELHSVYPHVTIVPNDPSGDYLNATESLGEGPEVSKWIETVNAIRYQFRKIKISILLLCMPLGLLTIHLLNGFVRVNQKEFDVAVPVTWGIFTDREDPRVAGVKRVHDDAYLYGPELGPGQIVHIFGDWHFPKPVEKAFQKAMKQKGFHYLRKKGYCVTGRFIKLVFFVMVRIFQSLLRRGNFNSQDLVLRYATTKGIFYYLKKQLEMDNVKYRVEFVRNDYNPAHVINTIVCHQHHRRVIGTAHAASSYDCPQLAYAYFDQYLSLCELYAQTFGEYWKNMHLVHAGRESVDWLFRGANEQDKIKDLIRQLYGSRLHVITVLFPGLASVCTDQRWKAMYQGFEQLCNHEFDAVIFMRFRTKQFLEDSKVKPFLSFPERDSRMVIDLTHFSTFDLIAVSDLVITANASFGINEALLVGKKVFTFGFTLKEELYFPADRYGKDFVLTTPEDLVKIIGDMPNGFSKCDVRWEALLNDSDYYRDGHNCDRIRSIVLQESKKVVDLSHSTT